MSTKPMIFVFGSNTAGLHGAGAARHALLVEGAEYGRGIGLVGNSYAIPTKGHTSHKSGYDGKTFYKVGGPLPLSEIKKHVSAFKNFAEMNPDLTFKVTRIGCGLAGFEDSQIAPMFKGCPSNCLFDGLWAQYLGNDVRFWGSF